MKKTIKFVMALLGLETGEEAVACREKHRGSDGAGTSPRVVFVYSSASKPWLRGNRILDLQEDPGTAPPPEGQ